MLSVRLVEPPKEVPALKMTLIQHGLYVNDSANVWLYRVLTEFANEFRR